jgi:hypothetical protein
MNFTSGPWPFEKDNTLKTENKEIANELSNFFTSVLTKRSDRNSILARSLREGKNNT